MPDIRAPLAALDNEAPLATPALELSSYAGTGASLTTPSMELLYLCLHWSSSTFAGILAPLLIPDSEAPLPTLYTGAPLPAPDTGAPLDTTALELLLPHSYC